MCYQHCLLNGNTHTGAIGLQPALGLDHYTAGPGRVLKVKSAGLIDFVPIFETSLKLDLTSAAELTK